MLVVMLIKLMKGLYFANPYGLHHYYLLCLKRNLERNLTYIVRGSFCGDVIVFQTYTLNGEVGLKLSVVL